MTHGKPLHHLHKRKRISQKLEPYPHPEKHFQIVDKLIYAAAIIGPLLTIPQAYNVWILKNAGGVSIITWLFMSFASATWLWYGIVHKDKPIIFSSIIWLVMQTLIWTGTVIYR